MSIKKIFIVITLCCVFSSALYVTYAGEGIGGKDVTAISKKIDTKDLSGVNLWIADLYNNNRVMYAVVVTLVMAALGSILAFGTDLVLKRFGMNVSKISHSE